MIKNPKHLIISDCDEVLLHFIAPFSEWLEEVHHIRFDFSHGDFGRALIDLDTGKLVVPERIWELLNGFFDTEMERQSPIKGAIEAMKSLSQRAEIVILTNLLDHRREKRMAQLRQFRLDFQVFTNQGPKGEALKTIIDERAPELAIFIDDLPQHHQSASEIAPHCWRLHMVGEPRIAEHLGDAYQRGHAHARIDDWDQALPWLLEILDAGKVAPKLTPVKGDFAEDLIEGKTE